MISSEPDILVIGGGIAGASAAAELARTHRVLLLEGEDALGLHSTGRSAAAFSETYGNRAIRSLTRASRDFFYHPPVDFSPYPLLKRRSWLQVASATQASALESLLAKDDVALNVRRVCPEEALALCPLLRPETVAAGGAYDRDAADIDVDGLHRGYLRLLRQHRGTILTGAQVTALVRRAGKWLVESTAGAFQAPIVINAAGAWADRIAVLAGVAPLRIQACRRTAVLVELSSGEISAEWPLTIDIEEAYYFKPDAGLLLISPADETPVEPCDVQPEDLDVAIAIDRVERATLMSIKRVRRSWAGLRSFAPDRSPVIGFDEAAPGFFWLAGQGGYGIQTAPAAARLAAALLREERLPQSLAGLDPACVAPGRFASSN
ncbi:MAG TPA: FAD-dependent oxidoreductase [Steroidobacteraceae bacterium]|nr:FAD-dependent oxidoreductase [Steroidobacteraceae bacterium]